MILSAAKVNWNLQYTCGGGDLAFSGTFPGIVSGIVFVIKVIVPILLVIFGMIDLFKSVIASKEDEISKGYKIALKRLIAAIVVFFVVQAVQLVLNLVARDETGISNCFNCFINGKASDNACVLRN